MKSLFLCLLIAASTLSGCANSNPPSTTSMQPSLPANLAKPAAPVERPATSSWDDLAVLYMGLVKRYGQCVREREGLQLVAGSQSSPTTPSATAGAIR